MRRPYRYLRSELNGFYLRALAAMTNIAATDITDEFVYQTLFQWKLAGETAVPIREEDIYDIISVAGFFPLRVLRQTNIGSLSFSASHNVNGIERSERGLFDMQHEYMRYVRTAKESYSDDISNEADRNHRTSLVPDNAQPVGYVRLDTPVYDADGNIIEENILPEPPTDGSDYAPFYGEKYLTLENIFNKEVFLDLAGFKKLFECLQRIEYNGPSITGFLEMTQITGAGYINEIEIVPEGNYYIVRYRLNRQLDISDKIGRYNVWRYICKQKFKLFSLHELED